LVGNKAQQKKGFGKKTHNNTKRGPKDGIIEEFLSVLKEKELGFRRTGMIRVWCTAEDEYEEEEAKGASARASVLSVERASVVGFV
jgi:hypothetical protein